MNWKERIDLSFSLLKEFSSLVGGEDAKEVLGMLMAMSDFVHGDEFQATTDDEKHNTSVEILGDSIGVCASILTRSSKPEGPPKFMTYADACERLVHEYGQSISGDQEMAAMSLSEWIKDNNIVIVEPGDERLSSSAPEEPSPEEGRDSK